MKNYQEDKLLSEIFINQTFEYFYNLNKKEEINIEDFKDIYSLDVIKNDLKKLNEFEENINKKASKESFESLKRATIFEGLILKEVNRSYWLDNIKLIKSSRFDDVFNGIDLISEYQQKTTAAYLGLALDVTLSQELDSKIERIKKEIELGKLAEIKYFKSDFLNFKGVLYNLPRVIICADFKTVNQLAELSLENKREILLKHPFQLQILEEILEQLKVYRDYAILYNQEKLVEIYNRHLEIFKMIYEKRIDFLGGVYERDFGFSALNTKLLLLKVEIKKRKK